jgi:thioredoxin-related protein
MIRFVSLFAVGLLLSLSTSLSAQETAATERGKVTGGKVSTHPAWFKESFLDIGEDVSEAAEADKHVILFMEMNGCPYCFKMLEENFKNAPYKEFIQEHFDVIAINIKGDREVALNDEATATEKEVAGMLKVRYTPTVVFLNQDNQPVARINGYRNVEEFKGILDYVQEQAYKDQKLAAYLDARKKTDSYAFRPHPRLEEIQDLSNVTDRPLAVLFEDSACVACDALHDGHLKDPEVDQALAKMAFVRLDTLSDAPIVDPEGNKTTAKEFAARLGITYRPSIVLFDQGKEIVRIESMLYRYHFTGVLEYVAERQYEKYPGGPFRYMDVKTEELLESGEDVNISE